MADAKSIISPRSLGLIVGSTLVLTLSFIGLVGIVNGEVADVGARIPIYLLAMSVVFVLTVIALEDPQFPGTRIIIGATGIALLALVVTLLTGEGLVLLWRIPDEILEGSLVIYFVAASLIATGIGYWGIHHWRELAGRSSTFAR